MPVKLNGRKLENLQRKSASLRFRRKKLKRRKVKTFDFSQAQREFTIYLVVFTRENKYPFLINLIISYFFECSYSS